MDSYTVQAAEKIPLPDSYPSSSTSSEVCEMENTRTRSSLDNIQQTYKGTGVKSEGVSEAGSVHSNEYTAPKIVKLKPDNLDMISNVSQRESMGDVGLPETVPLPEATSTTYDSSMASKVSHGRQPSISSLEILESHSKLWTQPSLPIGGVIEGMAVGPELSILPKKGKKAKRRPVRHPSEAFQQPPPTSYSESVRVLSSQLTHLRNTCSTTRYRRVKLTRYDYKNNVLISKPPFICEENLARKSPVVQDRIRQALDDDVPDEATLRLIVIEELCEELIELLGSTFSMSPEFFEEHLLNSGWQNGKYIDLGAHTWGTRGIEKSYYSMRWFRPGMLAMSRPNSDEDYIELLESRRAVFEWNEMVVPDSGGKKHNVRHRSQTTTNILRRPWDLKTTAEPTRFPRPVAWEEKATVWRKVRDDVHIVVLLLDPLPILKDQMEGARIALAKLGFHLEEEADIAEASPTQKQNIEILPDRNNPDGPPVLIRHRTFAKAPARRRSPFASVFAPIFSGSTDPEEKENVRVEEGILPPEATEPDPTAPDEPQRDPTRQRARPKPKDVGLFGRLRSVFQGIPTAASAGSPTAPPVEEEEGTEIISLEPVYRSIFTSGMPRGPINDYDSLFYLHNVLELKKKLATTRSTSEDFSEWLERYGDQNANEMAHMDPLNYLFTIIHRDVLEFIRLIHESLGEIRHDMLDDVFIQRSLLHWRSLLEKFEIELRQLQICLRGFAVFISPDIQARLAKPERSKDESHIEHLLRECLTSISEASRSTTEAHRSLISNLSIVESKRGISEAESVTKLTELAFIFIPLSFSASVFGMQVKELDPSTVSISTFIIFSFAVIFSAYGIRLAIRSSTVIKRKDGLMAAIREHASLGPESPVPTSTFLGFLWRQIPSSVKLGFISLIIVIPPLGALWSRKMNNTFKAMISIVVILIELAIFTVVARATIFTGGETRRKRYNAARPRHPPRNHNSKSSYHVFSLTHLVKRWVSSRILLIFIASCTAAAPLIAIWLRPLAAGIKTGATVAIVLIYLLGIGIFATRGLYRRTLANRYNDSGSSEGVSEI